jgi:hypothetical protein
LSEQIPQTFRFNQPHMIEREAIIQSQAILSRSPIRLPADKVEQ